MNENRIQQHWLSSNLIKPGLIVILGLLLLIPLSMIKSVIREREATEKDVDIQMMQQWGGPQTVTGPILNIPIYYYSYDSEEKRIIIKKWLHVMPETLNVKTAIEPEIRYRGIYKKVVFQSKTNLSGNFGTIEEVSGDVAKIDWENAVITIGISENRGITGDAIFRWDKKEYEPQGGVVTNDILLSGISVKIPVNERLSSHTFNISLNLRGSKGVYINPIGKNTNVEIQSSWSDPSFTGSFLPTTRNITNDGFSATWQMTHLNRNFPQQWFGKKHNIDTYQIGVDLFVPVNHYQKSLRSAKYGLLIITLTILVFIFLELAKKKKIHLLQYILVGLALVLFFSILTALSEHIGFNLAYLIASLAIIVMVSSYSFAFLKDRKQALLIFSLLSIIYGFLFIILNLNDYAFLAGNIGLFIVLAIIMWVSDKVNLEEKENNSF